MTGTTLIEKKMLNTFLVYTLKKKKTHLNCHVLKDLKKKKVLLIILNILCMATLTSS